MAIFLNFALFWGLFDKNGRNMAKNKKIKNLIDKYLLNAQIHAVFKFYNILIKTEGDIKRFVKVVTLK